MTPDLHDVKSFLSTLTLQKKWNASKVFSSYYYSRLLSKPNQHGLPITLSIEPTTSCNLRCPECPSGLRSFTRDTGMLDPILLDQIIEEIGDELIYLYFYFQGEPFLHPDFLQLVHLASRKNIYSVTSTNAHYLDDAMAKQTVESGLNRLIISIDGTTQETYESYRIGGNLEKVIEGTRNIVKWKRKLKSLKPHVIFQFLVVGANEHQMDDIKRLADKLGIDEVKFKTVQINDFENGSPLMPSDEKYSRYKKNQSGLYELKNSLGNHCWKLWHSCVITWDGKVVPCCFDKDANHSLGNLKEQTFKEIWFGDKYNTFRKNLLKSRKEIDICTNCTEGTSVWI